MNKKDNELHHFKTRFAARFHQQLTDVNVLTIIEMIRESKSTVIKKQSNRKTRHRLTFEGKTIDVIYDTVRKMLVTALYPRSTDVKQHETGKFISNTPKKASRGK